MEFRIFLFGVIGFVGFFFFWNAADGKLAGSGGWQPTPGRGAGAILGPEPAPCARATSCHRREGPRPEGKKKWVHTANYRILAMTRSLLRPAAPQADFFLCVCTHKKQSKAPTGNVLSKHTPASHLCEDDLTRWADQHWQSSVHAEDISIHVNRDNVHLFLAEEVPNRYSSFVVFGFYIFF